MFVFPPLPSVSHLFLGIDDSLCVRVFSPPELCATARREAHQTHAAAKETERFQGRPRPRGPKRARAPENAPRA
eukprot:2468381-Pyramimonas_sp.AAC.1